MSAQLMNGKLLAERMRAQMAVEVAVLKAQYGLQPALAVLLAGEDAASQVYVRNKIAACKQIGLHSIERRLAADASFDEVRAQIEDWNTDPRVHGILVQLPLPAHLPEDAVLELVHPEKDVDGFHALNVGALMQGKPRFLPCTPFGVMKMLEDAKTPLAGAHAVIVGRSNIVGKPMALLLLAQSCTVTICHSRTRALATFTRQADILIAAVGRAKMITAEMVKPGATVIDVGINRDEMGKLCGDVDFEQIAQVAGHISPVPGGVGPMTVTMLTANTLTAAKNSINI